MEVRIYLGDHTLSLEDLRWLEYTLGHLDSTLQAKREITTDGQVGIRPALLNQWVVVLASIDHVSKVEETCRMFGFEIIFDLPRFHEAMNDR